MLARSREALPALVFLALCLLLISGAACRGNESSADEDRAASEAPGESAPVGGRLLVSAASDLAPVMEELVPLFEGQTGATVELNLGSTGQLTQQIASGAPADVFLAASASAVDDLPPDRVVAGTRAIYAVGRVVMWSAPEASFLPGSLEELGDPRVRRISLANPDHAPYGRAAREALETAGLWEELRPRLVMAENVRQAFQFVSSGNVDVGLIALSLALSAGGDYALVPAEMHTALEQTLAVLRPSRDEALARRFAEFILGPEARSVLDTYGFELPG